MDNISSNLQSNNNREYIRIPKYQPLPDSTIKQRELNNSFWKSSVFHHLIAFYRFCNIEDIYKIIKTEKAKPQSNIEDAISKYIRKYLNNNPMFCSAGFIVKGGVNNDKDIKGLYDITFFHSNWRTNLDEEIDFNFECKNLNLCNDNDLINKYIYYNTYKKDKNNNEYIYDGGMMRFFNAKYSQNENFGGMIGYIIDGNLETIKAKIISQLDKNFTTLTPEGDLIKVIDNSIENNSFTFDSLHNRFNKEFTLHHLLFDFSNSK